MSKLNNFKNEYLEYLKIRNYAELSIKSVEHSLRYFIDYVLKSNITEPEGITENHIQSYQKYRYYYENKSGKQDSAHTQNTHVSRIRQWFRYMRKNGYINYNPAEEIEFIREPKKVIKIALTDQEVRKILRQPDINTLRGYRDRTILEVLYATGVRRNELCKFKLKDVYLQEGLLKVEQGKGKKDRMVPIGKVAEKYLEQYIKFVRLELLRDAKSEYLFISEMKRGLSKDRVSEIVSYYAKQAGIDKEVTAHTLRRTCATEMIRRKANVMHVSRLLGHEKLESIKPYCDLTIIDLKKAHEKYHPRERDL